MFEIREIRPDEHSFLFEMLYEAIYVPDGGEKLPRSEIYQPHLSKYVEDFGRKGDLALVLIQNDKLTGAIWVRLFPVERGGYGFVDELTPELSMAIVEEFRGRGFGAMMVENICDKLKKDGVEKVSLSVDKQNRAVKLYKKCGFEILDDTGTAYTMLKKL